MTKTSPFPVGSREHINFLKRESRKRNPDSTRLSKQKWRLTHSDYIREKGKLYRSQPHVKERLRKIAERYKETIKKIHLRNRLIVLAKIDPSMKCVRCGCSDYRLIEINHKNNDGYQERKSGKNIVNDILIRNRPVDDLELTCRPCNSLYTLENRIKGNTGHIILWHKSLDLNITDVWNSYDEEE